MAINPQLFSQIFGGSPGVSSLSSDDKRQIALQSIMSMGANMLQGSQTSTGSAPSFGKVLGGGLQAGMQAQQQGTQQAQLAQMRDMQMQQYQAAIEKRKQEQQRERALRAMVGGGTNYQGQGFAGQANTTPGQSIVPNLPPQAQAALKYMSPEILEQTVYQRSGLTPQAETLSSEELQALGLPEGTLAQRDPVTGGIKLLREGFDEDAYRRQQQISFGYQRQLAEMKAKADAGQLDVRDKKALNLMNQGMDQSMAYNVVDGIVDYEINEKTGRIVYTNKATGEVKEVPLANPQERTPYEGPTVYQLNQQGDVTGPDAAFMRGANVVGGWLGADVGADETRAGQFVEATTQNLLRALSNNPRYPVGEMERLRQEINLNPQILDSNEAFRNRIVAIDTALRQRLRNEQRVANDPNMPADSREAAAQAASDISNYLEQLGAPRGNGGGGNVPTIEINTPRGNQPAGEIPPVPEGVDPGDWQYMTPEERALWQ